MGWLEMKINIGLARPLLVMCCPQAPLVTSFHDTGNTVYLEPPDRIPPSDYQKNLGGIQRLYEFVKVARGGELFYEDYGKGIDDQLNHQRACIDQLSGLRNKLVHQGRNAIPEGAALKAALSVLNAIEWLFTGPDGP